MRDDIKLSNDVFLPRQPGRYPTILLRTPYETLHEPHIDWAVWWAKRGYAVVIQDCRGRFESEGTFYPYRDDGPDGHDTLEWISTPALVRRQDRHQRPLIRRDLPVAAGAATAVRT